MVNKITRGDWEERMDLKSKEILLEFSSIKK